MAGDEVIVETPVFVETSLDPFSPLAPESPSDGNYVISALTVVDNTTNLMIQRIDDDTIRSWDEAWTYCRTLSIDGISIWRLPSWQELQSIVSYGDRSPAINQVAFPSTNESTYWTATTDVYLSSAALRVSFLDGITLSALKDSNAYVRCVR